MEVWMLVVVMVMIIAVAEFIAQSIAILDDMHEVFLSESVRARKMFDLSMVPMACSSSMSDMGRMAEARALTMTMRLAVGLMS